MNIYEYLLEETPNLREAEDISSIDLFLSSDKVKVSSMSDLIGFSRVDGDTLIHKAQKDLWRISENQQGEVVIERLFDPSTKEPLRI